MSLTSGMPWPYFDLCDGFLHDEDGEKLIETRFSSEWEAEKYLIDNNIRGTVR